MVKIEGVYVLERSEKFFEYLADIDPSIKDYMVQQPESVETTLTIAVEGNKYTLKHAQGSFLRVISFVLDEPFEEIGLKNIKLDSIGTLKGNTIFFKYTASDGHTGERDYVFSENGLEIIYRANITSIVGKQIYKRK